MDLRRIAPVVLLLVLPSALLGGYRWLTTDTRPTRVILITIDTLRADRTSLHGYARDTTPFLTELAARGIVYDHAYAVAPWTTPSMATIVTGLPTHTHGMDEGGEGKVSKEDRPVLPAALTTVAEAFHDAGFTTFGVSTNGHCAGSAGFAVGFDHFAEPLWADSDAVEAEVGRFARAWREADRAFLWLHYLDPHGPYVPRSPWIEQYAPDDAREYLRRWPRGVRGGDLRRESDQSALSDLYDSEIAATDASLRAVFATLGVDDRALVVVTSDHGEAFYEHGVRGHASALYDEQVRVPMLVRPRGGVRPRRVQSPVSIASVMATLLDAAGIPYDADGIAAPLPRRDVAVPVFFDLRIHRVARGVRSGPWKLVQEGEPTEATWLYHLDTDPGEHTDVAAAHPEQVRALEAEREAHRRRWPTAVAGPARAPVNAEDAEMLRVLGYVE